MNRFLEMFRSLGAARMLVLLGAAIGVAATLAFTVFHVGAQPMSLLYSDLDLGEASQITTALDQAGIRYEAKGDGSVIMVPRDKVASTRLLLGGKGLPSAGNVTGYEIFDKSNGFGQTEFTQNVNFKRALEGELVRTINSLDGVSSSRVMLVMPERRLFQEQADQPTATVVVGFNREPASDQVHALQNLVAAAVPGLQPDHVVITDQRTKKTLAGGDGQVAAADLAAQQRSTTEEALERKVKELVEGVVGPGRARVNISADLELSHTTTQEETYNPDAQVVVSSQTSENNSQNGSSTASGGDVSAANNLPENAASNSGEQSTSGATTEITNFQNSKTVTTRIVEPGAIKRISVAVAVDATPPVGADGKPVAGYQAPDASQIEALVKAAIGFDDQRGDLVTVSAVPFQHDPVAEGGVEAKAGLLSGFTKNDIMRGAELLVLLIVSALTIFFIGRPLLKNVSAGGLSPMPMLAGAGAGAGGQQVLNAPSGPLSAQIPFENGEKGQGGGQGQPARESNIDIARIEGQVKASAVKQVSEFVERHPDESVSILRSWLHEA